MLGAGRLSHKPSDRTFHKLANWSRIQKQIHKIATDLQTRLAQCWGESVAVDAHVGRTGVYLNVYIQGGKVAHVSIHSDARIGYSRVGSIHSKYDPIPGSAEHIAFTRIVAKKVHNHRMRFEALPHFPKSCEQQLSDDIARIVSDVLTRFSTRGWIGGTASVSPPHRMTEVHCHIWHSTG